MHYTRVKKLNSTGAKTHPCFTPAFISINCVNSASHYSTLSLFVELFHQTQHLWQTSNTSRPIHNNYFLPTESKAYFMSIKVKHKSDGILLCNKLVHLSNNPNTTDKSINSIDLVFNIQLYFCFTYQLFSNYSAGVHYCICNLF